MTEKYYFVQRDKESSVYTAVGKLLTDRGDWQKQPPDSPRFNLMLGDRNKLPWHKIGQVPGLTQVINYYRGSEIICRKTSMVRYLRDYCKNAKIAESTWLPKSFILRPSKQMSALGKSGQNVRYQVESQQDERNILRQFVQAFPESIWIVKTTAGSKGKGIKISQSVEELIQYVDDQSSAYVCQQYIDRPLLLPHDRKFDIRCWVLVDIFYNVYLYREGVLRTASETYCPDFSNLSAHLTNHCLQKELSENFGRYEDGNEMFFNAFDGYLRSNYKGTMEMTVLPQIRTIVKTCFLIIQEHISTLKHGYWSFQLFGLDFLLDENLKIWLLEINGAPAVASKLFQDLVQNLVELAIDPAFPPHVKVQYRENLFEKIV